MDRPGHLLLAAALVVTAPLYASEPASPLTSTNPAAAATDTAPPARNRAVSPHLAAALAAKPPSYASAPATDPSSAAAASTAPALANLPDGEKPAGPAVQLPKYIVRELRLPKETEALSQRGVEALAMNRYLGSYDNLDRGILNFITLNDLWRKIPVLKYIPLSLSITNEQRAMIRYEEDRRLEQMNDYKELADLARKSGDLPGAAALQREADRTFRHPSPEW